jgi:Mg-chelatase subunit ChlD
VNFLTKIKAFNTRLEAKINGGRPGISHAGRQAEILCDNTFTKSIIIIDRSGSMGCRDYSPSRLQAAKDAAVEYVMTLLKQKTQHQIAVISFGDDAKVVVPLTAIDSCQRIVNGIRSISINGCTNIAAGLTQAAELLAKCSDKHSQIILLTDGYGSCHIGIPEKLKGEYKATIDVVGIGGSPKEVNEFFLRQIATTDPDGTNHYRFIKDAHSLKQHYRQLACGLAWKGGNR